VKYGEIKGNLDPKKASLGDVTGNNDIACRARLPDCSNDDDSPVVVYKYRSVRTSQRSGTFAKMQT
jgi:hypothetical protein